MISTSQFAKVKVAWGRNHVALDALYKHVIDAPEDSRKFCILVSR